MTPEASVISADSSADGCDAFIVALTGGIASGKTVVSDYFRELGVPIIDTDIIARELVEPSEPANRRIRMVFGRGYFLHDGRLDRETMRVEIFKNPESKKKLEQILHPLIRLEALERIKGIDFPYCILVIPLYVESKDIWQADRVLVVDANKDTQLRRLMARDRIDVIAAEAILSLQSTRKDRLELADEVIQNNNGLSEVEAAVNVLHNKFLRLADQKRPTNRPIRN